MRLGRVLAVLPTSLTLAFVAAGVALAARKVWPQVIEERWAWAVIAGAVLAVLINVAHAALRRLPPRAGALALDRHHRLAGRLSNALEFAEIPAAERTPFMGAAIEDACSVGEKLSARGAVRIVLSREILVSVLVGAAVVGISLLEVRVVRPPVRAAQAATFEPLVVAPDDLELFREAVEELARQDQTPEVKEAIERFNKLLTDIAERRLNRTDAFRKMQEIENDLLEGAEADRKALEEALQDTAKELEKSELTRPTAEAMAKKDLESARKELNKLAEQLQNKDASKKPDKAALERLRKALDRAAQNKQKALEELNERRAELQEELLKKKQEKKDAPKNKKEEEREEQLLKKKKRELERLNREIEQKERAMRRLNRLDRDLAKAAADLLRDLGLSGEDLQQAAEELNRMQQEAMSDKDKEELRRRLQELRELLRQQGQGGEKMRQRLQRFLKRARGGKGGKPGKGDQGQGGERRPGQGQPGQDGKMGEGEGQGQGDRPGGLVLGPGGTPIPVDMPGAGQGSGDQPGGEGPGEGGKEWGTGSGGDPEGDKTDIDGATHDVRADAVDSQAGPTNAEVILSAADRGFTGRPYKKIYKQYQTVAEDQIDKEKIPDGMRFYVRRYFQLIRPRE